MTRQITREKWDAIIEDLESSGLSSNRYADQHQISKSSLYSELRKRRARHTHNAEPPAVHEFKLSELTVYPSSQALKINLGDVDLTFDELPDPQWLATLIRGLER